MDTLLDNIISFLPMYRHRVASSAIVSFNKKPVLDSHEGVPLLSVQENPVLLQYATILLRSATEDTSFPFG